MAAGIAAAGGDGVFEVTRTQVKPKQAYFGAQKRPTLRYRFQSAGEKRRVTVRVINVRSKKVVGRWTEPHASPGLHRRSWSGARRSGKMAPDGRYAFRIDSPGYGSAFGGRFRLHNYTHPIVGRHGTRGAVGKFGAPRSGGRTHEGFDVTAPCGTPLEAARAGRVEKRGYDPRLYGNYIRVDARKSPIDYFYAHMQGPARAGTGDRVKTGQVLGKVGVTGNAAGTPCHLHIELRSSGRLVDPEPKLRRWDR